MTQITRPEQIDVILTKLNAQYQFEMRSTLETYIAKLEDHQIVDDETFIWDVDNPPMWSHARYMERQAHRRERAERNRKAFE